MECTRCEQKKPVEYRVFSDIIEMKVCADCAAEARELDLGIEVLDCRTELGAEYMRKAS